MENPMIMCTNSNRRPRDGQILPLTAGEIIRVEGGITAGHAGVIQQSRLLADLRHTVSNIGPGPLAEMEVRALEPVTVPLECHY